MAGCWCSNPSPPSPKPSSVSPGCSCHLQAWCSWSGCLSCGHPTCPLSVNERCSCDSRRGWFVYWGNYKLKFPAPALKVALSFTKQTEEKHRLNQSKQPLCLPQHVKSQSYRLTCNSKVNFFCGFIQTGFE